MAIYISDPQYVPRVGEFPDAELQYIQNSEVELAKESVCCDGFYEKVTKLLVLVCIIYSLYNIQCISKTQR